MLMSVYVFAQSGRACRVLRRFKAIVFVTLSAWDASAASAPIVAKDSPSFVSGPLSPMRPILLERPYRRPGNVKCTPRRQRPDQERARHSISPFSRSGGWGKDA